MAQRIVNSEQIRARIKEAGLLDQDVAAALALTPAQFSLSLSGKRDFSFQDARKLGAAIGMPFTEVLRAFDLGPPDPADYRLIVAGNIWDDGATVHLPSIVGQERVPTTFAAYEGLLFELATDLYAPRFRRGEYLGSFHPARTVYPLGEQRERRDATHLYGREVMAALAQPLEHVSGAAKRRSRVQYGILREGLTGDTFNLIGANPQKTPLLGIKISAVAPIDLHIPEAKIQEWPSYAKSADLAAMRDNLTAAWGADAEQLESHLKTVEIYEQQRKPYLDNEVARRTAKLELRDRHRKELMELDASFDEKQAGTTKDAPE